MTRLLAVLAFAGATVLVAAGCSPGPGPAEKPCAQGTASYGADEVALLLDSPHDSQKTYRLPVGKVALAGSGTCAGTDALQILGRMTGANQGNSATPRQAGASNWQAFRAVRTGGSEIYAIGSCGEACMAQFIVHIDVTDGCIPLTHDQAMDKALNRNPMSRPQGSSPPPGPNSITATSMSVGQYWQSTYLPGVRPLGIPTYTPVWAVLMSYKTTTTTLQWIAVAVDPCTDRVFGEWAGTSPPAGLG